MTFPHYPPSSPDVDFDKDIDVDINIDLDTTVDIYKTVDIDVWSTVYADVCIDGNTADVTFDIEAVGEDTFTSLDIAVLTIEDDLSSISGAITSAVG
ncbi:MULTISPECIES: hypothetical protein [unclassified Salipiger]|uniref:hypothetical protein n=1 Tax=unclassified Salipiger TaxID=2640570 RepID=UPI0013BBD1CB|nr:MULTISPECIES: hypothetical protein [unclassified Salipiger]NDV49630.1 hypothetical protein [Salipiger sp. PrR003]NDW34496.1 hypothetical protein [Salipiger sp. PrR007]